MQERGRATLPPSIIGLPPPNLEASATPSAPPHAAIRSTLDCIFHDVTVGDTDEPCKIPYGCYQPGGHFGVLSTLDSAYRPAYVAGTGWDFATGLGSVDAANLVKNWPR
jgi:hypothetical protein